MSGVALAPQRATGIASLLGALALALLSLAVLAGPAVTLVAAPCAGVLLLAAVAVSQPVVPWRHLLVGLLLVILFIPLRRYRLPGDVGISLEPYRLLVAVLLAGWCAGLLADPRIRLRRSGLEAPIALTVVAILASVIANPARAGALQPVVLKAVTFMVSFLVVFYLVVSVVRSRRTVDALVKTLVAGATVIGLLALIEARTGFSPFAHLHVILPFLLPDPGFALEIDRGSARRVFGPAEHPIALGAALVMILPFAVYLARTAGRRWLFALMVLTVGVLSTVSRTGVLMLLVVAVVFLWLRPRETRRLWPLLLPMVVAVQLAAPGTLGSLAQSFVPDGGLITEQQGMAGSCSSAGRIADLGPTLADVARQPFLGYGFGTRVTTGPQANACILDNQWLGTLVDVGLLGVVAWLLLFGAVLRRMGRRAREDHSATGWVLAAVTASVMAYAVGNLTFDALGFSQVVFLLFVILGIGAASAANEPCRARDGARLQL